MIKNRLAVLFVALVSSVASFGQIDTIYNSKALAKIPYYEQLYRFRVWRTINFKEKQNAVFTSPKADIVNFLLENLKAGKLKAYGPIDYDFYKEIPVADAIGKASSVDPNLKDFDPNKDYGAGDQAKYNGKIYTAARPMVPIHPPTDAEFWRLDRVKKVPANIEFDANKGYVSGDIVSFGGKQYTSLADMKSIPLPSDQSYWTAGDDVQPFYTKEEVQTIQIVEDVIFDKRRSRLYYDIIGFVILEPSTGNPNGLISFKEFSNLVETISHDREMRVRNTVIWKNRYNPSQDMNYNDAFKLRLFHGIIWKVENPDDMDISRIYSDNGRTYGESVFARWEEEMKMMEKEHNLWEY